MLNLPKALQLAKLLDPYIPDDPDFDAPILDFVGKILDNIVSSGKHADYLAALELMTGKTIDELVGLDSFEVLDMFTSGLVENKILALIEFYRGIGTKIWQTKPL